MGAEREREIRFADLVHAGTPGPDAAAACGCRGKRTSLCVAAARMMKRAGVQARLAELRAASAGTAIAAREEALRLLTEHLRADLGPYMRFEEAPAQRTAGGADVVAEAQPGTGLNGETSGAQQSRRFVGFDLEAMRRDGKTRLLAGLKVRELFVEGQVIGHVVDVKIQDVQGSIDRLCKMLGWNEPEKIEHTFKPEEMTEAQLRAEADKILRPPKNKKE